MWLRRGGQSCAPHPFTTRTECYAACTPHTHNPGNMSWSYAPPGAMNIQTFSLRQALKVRGEMLCLVHSFFLLPRFSLFHCYPLPFPLLSAFLSLIFLSFPFLVFLLNFCDYFFFLLLLSSPSHFFCTSHLLPPLHSRLSSPLGFSLPPASRLLPTPPLSPFPLYLVEPLI